MRRLFIILKACVGWLWRHPILSLLLFVLTAVLLTAAGLHLAGLRHYRLAQAAIEQRDLDTARQHLQFCLSVWPYDSECRLLAARIERLDGNFAQFEEYLKECRRLQNGPTERDQLEAILQRAQTGDFERVEQGLLLWLKENPEHRDAPFVWEVLARAKMRNAQYSLALIFLNQWLKVQPESARALSWHGLVSVRLFSDYDALKDYRRAAKLAPRDWKIHTEFVDLLLGANNLSEAEAELEYLSSRRPDDSNVQLARGRLLFLQKNIDAARNTLTKAIDDGCKDINAPLTLAEIELQAGNLQAAEKWSRKAIELDDTSLQGHYHLYRSLLLQPNRQKEAQLQFARYKQLGRDLHELKVMYDSLMIKERYGPVSDPSLFTHIGELCLRLGLKNEGIWWLQRALKDDPHFESAQALLRAQEAKMQPAVKNMKMPAKRNSFEPPDRALEVHIRTKEKYSGLTPK